MATISPTPQSKNCQHPTQPICVTFRLNHLSHQGGLNHCVVAPLAHKQLNPVTYHMWMGELPSLLEPWAMACMPSLHPDMVCHWCEQYYCVDGNLWSKLRTSPTGTLAMRYRAYLGLGPWLQTWSFLHLWCCAMIQQCTSKLSTDTYHVIMSKCGSATVTTWYWCWWHLYGEW